MDQLPPGTDLTAIIWKTLQSTQIQTQLDQSHNLYEIQKLGNIPENTKLRYYSDNYDFRIANIDKDLRKINNARNGAIRVVKRTKRSNSNIENGYLNKMRNLFHKIYDILLNTKSLDLELIKNTIREDLVETPTLRDDPVGTQQDLGWLANLANYTDVRKNKEWVRYILSDFIPREGLIHPHPIFNKIPGWLFDAIQISNRQPEDKKLFIIYSTDIRGINEWMGQLCSLINIHNLLSVNLEAQQGLNCTAILVHLAGILSTRPLNSINRQGMSFPDSILQKTTFENVKKFLSQMQCIIKYCAQYTKEQSCKKN